MDLTLQNYDRCNTHWHPYSILSKFTLESSVQAQVGCKAIHCLVIDLLAQIQLQESNQNTTNMGEQHNPCGNVYL